MTPEETLISYQKTIIEKWVSWDPLALQGILDFFHPTFSGFGSGLHEITENREQWVQMMNKEVQEVPASPTVELAWVKAKTIKNTGYTWGLFHLKVPTDGQFIEMKNFRFSITWVKEKDWKAIHMHNSAPWVMQQDGEAYPIEALQARNRELEKMVAEKTADLVEKNRELEIEAALERVRAASMTMQLSSQFIEVCKILRNQLEALGLVNEFDAVEILLINKDVEMVTNYQTQEVGPNQQWKLEVAVDEMPEFRQFYNDWKAFPPAQRKENLTILEFQGSRFDALLEWAIKRRVMTAAEKEAFIELAEQLKKTGWYGHYVFFKNGAINIGKSHKLSVPQLSIAHRFAATFEQTYTRFLDLQKAEAQAKEAQIEAALERVRAQTMAMHKSEELSKVVTVMFKEFQQLELINEVARTTINFIDEENGDIVTWLTGLGGEEISNKFEYSVFGNELYEAEYRTYQQVAKDKRKEHKYIATFEGKAFEELIAFALEKRIMPPEDKKLLEEKGIQQWIEHSVYFAYGSLCVHRATPLSDDAFNILQRFAAVFEQTYIRFLDLQKAEQQAREIERVFNENERLLHSILPVEVVKELLETGSVKPARFEEVSILFSDFIEFTNIVATIPTRKLISELNELFSTFDDIMASEGIEKIKTVGDAYLAASGLPEEVPDHAIRCIRAAKKMIDFLNRRNETSAIKWKIRIGIHSGPIAAGVVGKNKFAYDIFGDTINIASRIETAGEEGKINVSAYTYDLIKEQFPCEYRGKISAKGKGDLDMYFVK